MRLAGKNVVVVGAGASGIAAARFAKGRGAHVIVNDGRKAEALGERGEQAAEVSKSTVFGTHPESLFLDADVIVVSPGVPDLPGLGAARQKGVEVIGEVELAARFIKSTLVGITGTNGKSTVTTLIGQMCEASGRSTFVGGNLGRPMIEAVDLPAAQGEGLVVVELSSFQLERVDRFHVHVGVLLNITDDHLDRYENFDAYAAAKANLFHNQTHDDHRVLPANDQGLEALVRENNGHLHRFGGDAEVRVDGAELKDLVSGLP